MALLLSAMTPEEARARQHDVLDVTLVEWARATTDSYPIATATGVKGFPYTPRAVIIGPRSTVDRCWVSWNSQRTLSGSPLFMTRELSIDTPLLFGMPANSEGALTTAPVSLITDAQDDNMLFFFPTMPVPASPIGVTPPGVPSTVTPESYLQADGTEVEFGPDNISPPVLELRFILSSAVPVQATKRFPYQNWVNFPNALPAEEYAAAYFPTYGRKNIIIQATSDEVGAIFRVAALRVTNQTLVIQETTEAQKTIAVANESLRIQLCDPMADWLIVYVTTASGNAGARIMITARD